MINKNFHLYLHNSLNVWKYDECQRQGMRQIPLSLGIFFIFTEIEIECYFLGILGTNRGRRKEVQHERI